MSQPDNKQQLIGGAPPLEREDRLGKHPFAGFGTLVEDITGSGYWIYQKSANFIGGFLRKRVFCVFTL